MTEVVPRTVLYCGVCTLPPEYCEFGGAFKRCKAWLEDNDHELFAKLYSVEALTNAVQASSISAEKQEEIDRKLQKQQQKDEAKAERELLKKLASKVVIKRIERSKRKRIISVSGLEVFELDLKKLSKTFSSKFATGASVTKTADGKEEIVIQGDVGDGVEELITQMLKDKGLNQVKVEQIDEKKKKKE